MEKIQNSLLITPGKGQKKHKKIYNSPLYLTSGYKEINSIGLYLQKVNETSSLSFKEEKKLFQRLEEGDLKAKETLIKANLQLVISIARLYTNSNWPMLDLIQEGNIGLMRAIDRFDYTKGKYKLSTYAGWWIHQSIGRALEDKSRMIRKPVYIEESIDKLDRAYWNLCKQLHREPTLKEIGQEMSISLRQVQFLLQLNQDTLSLDAPAQKESRILNEVIKNPKTTSLVKSLLFKSLQEKFYYIFKVLTNRQRNILLMRFGIGGYCECETEEIANLCHISINQVRQLENQAIRKLRHPNQRHKVKDFLQ